MELLQSNRRGDPAHYAAIATKLATRAEAEPNFDKALTYWRIASDWHRLGSDAEAVKTALIAAAETYAKDARHRISEGFVGRYMTASGLLARAIEAYRSLAGTQPIIAKLHRELIEYEKLSVAEYKHFDVEPPDLSKIEERIIAGLDGLPLRESLLALALVVGPVDAAAALRRTERLHLSGEFDFHSLMAIVHTNAMGRTVAKAPSLVSSDPEEVKRAIEAQTFTDLRHHWNLAVHGCIEPARRFINSRHYVALRDFRELARDNPFVPEDREYIYAKGLHSGMSGDFLTASHLLMPQVENSLRHLLEGLGHPASGIDSQGIQDVRSLNTILQDERFAMPLEQLLGRDMMFDLRGLLVERFGANLRNDLAHGLLGGLQPFSPPILYFWWLTLRLVCLPVSGRLAGAGRGEAEGSSDMDGPESPEDPGESS